MAQVYIHLVFSTKGRSPMLPKPVADDLHAHLGGIAKNKGCQPHGIGGTVDHVHLLLELNRSTSLAALVRDLKSNSSSWMRERQQAFAWQTGYGAFSFGPRDLRDLQEYVANQEEHHKVVTFQDEFRKLLTEHGLQWDERYVWD